VTCRSAHYQALNIGLVKAARIAIDPVPAPGAHAYLTGRTTDPVRWQPLLDTLQNYPVGLLAQSLSTPWRLCLTATVYADEGDPSELLAHASPGALDEHLLARYIPAANQLRPHPDYTPAQVHSWLHHLSTHLANGTTGTAGVVGTDLVLHQLWPLAGRTRVRVADCIFTLLTTLLLTLPCVFLFHTSERRFHVGLLIAGMATAMGLHAMLRPPASPKRLHWQRLATLSGLGRIAGGFLTGLAGGLVAGLVVGLVGLFLGLFLGLAALTVGLPHALKLGLTAGLLAGVAVGLAAGVVVGLVVSLSAVLAGEPTAAARPRDLIRADGMFGLVVGLVSGALGGLLVGLSFWLVVKFVDRVDAHLAVGDLSDWLVHGLVAGLAVGLVVGLSIGAQASRRYLVFLLCSRRRLPLRLGAFLDWAIEAGLMRLSGPIYQFRHRELQQWLTQHPTAP
jgi:hypothetical protein